jgi:hypothetical protein
MRRAFLLALALVVAVPPPADSAEPKKPKRHAVRSAPGRGGYGFLPGYRPPEVVDWEENVKAWSRGPTYWYGGPRFYRGRWNGGGFGPCWTQTPIGPVWNCGK